jgi:hypothetical protein
MLLVLPLLSFLLNNRLSEISDSESLFLLGEPQKQRLNSVLKDKSTSAIYAKCIDYCLSSFRSDNLRIVQEVCDVFLLRSKEFALSLFLNGRDKNYSSLPNNTVSTFKKHISGNTLRVLIPGVAPTGDLKFLKTCI